MGGGDLNMKKSWHPLLMKNQERVWLEEKKALEERKKLDQLRKEKEEERQMQELQRLQEEQTGRKRTEKLEWMYATPATGTTTNSSELEDYLLGKKRVDKLLTGSENQELGASHKNFIAVQNANTVRDVAAKVREDPLYAIKQQEQQALKELMANPLRLKELQSRNGIENGNSKRRRDKESKRLERHRKKDRRRHSRDTRSRSKSPSVTRRSYSPLPRNLSQNRSGVYLSNSHTTKSSGSLSSHRNSVVHDGHQRRGRNTSEEPDGFQNHEVKPQDSTSSGRRNEAMPQSNKSHRKQSDHSDGLPYHEEQPRFISAPSNHSGKVLNREDRLAAMTRDAHSANEERQIRLRRNVQEEERERDADMKDRHKSRGIGSFINLEQKRVFGGLEGGLGEHMRRGKVGMVVDGE